jgi:hypothetical protein
MGLIDWPALRAIVGVADSDVRLACRVGSHVYGTARAGSDEDFVVVLRGSWARDLILGPRVNVTVQGEGAYAEALAAQSVFALEARFAPAEHLLRVGEMFGWKLDRRALVASVRERASADLAKGLRTLPHEPDRARKRLFHALRVPTFALQLAREERISDYTAANGWFEEIFTEPSDDPAVHAARWEPALAGLLAALDR